MLLLFLTIFFGCEKEKVSIGAEETEETENFVTIPDHFPLSVNNGELMTGTGDPYLIVGDSPWYLIQGLDREGTETYLENRRLKNINSLLMCLIAAPHIGSANAYGNEPFLVANDFSTPNPAYFEHVDFVLNNAAEKGIAIFLYPAWLGFDMGNDHPEGFFEEIITNGPEKMYQYGRFIGTRYKDYRNIIWVMGGDAAPGPTLPGIRSLVKGIEDAAGEQIFAVHNARFVSGVMEYANEEWLDLNTTYSDFTNAAKHLKADYNRDYPFYFAEGSYENTKATAVQVRSQMYTPVLMGSHGYFYGNARQYSFDTGWNSPQVLESQGSKDLERSGAFFRSRTWHNLVPDLSHNLLINGNGDINSSEYATAALMKDSSTAIIYTPDERSLTIDLTGISGSETKVWWYQPSTGYVIDAGVYTDTKSRVFIPPAAGDWLLVLDDVKLNLAAPGQYNGQAY